MGFLTLSGSFLKVNAIFPVVLGGVFLAIKSYLASPLSDQLVAAYPVPVDQVPVFSAVLMAFYAFFSGIIAIMVTAAITNHMDNNTPRITRGPDLIKVSPVAYRFMCVHNNSIEVVVYMIPCYWAALALKLDPLLFAKLSALLPPARALYSVFYVVDNDVLRSTSFVFQSESIFLIGFASMFPSVKALLA